LMDTFDGLRNGVVLAELGGYGDGPYCAQHGAGAALVMLGTYIVDPGSTVPYPPSFVFKPDRAVYRPYLRENIRAARVGGAKVGVSVATVELSHTLDFLKAAEESEADYASLCAHSSMEMFVNHRLGDHLCRNENTNLLRRWVGAILNAVAIPVVVKIALIDPFDTLNAVRIMADVGVPIIHINIRESTPDSEGLGFLESLRGVCQCLIAGGGVRDIEGARRVLAAGADAVAIGAAAMEDAELCGNLQRGLRATA